MIRAMLAGCLFALAAAAQGGELRGRVVAVMDGDTLAVLDAGRQEHRIRLAEIDAPEKGQPFGQRSKQSLSGLCFGREAVIEDRGHDRYGRAKLLALASFLWGSTTWLNGIARTYPAFLASRASTGIDDSSYPGIYSLIADYFGPKVRGRIYGLLEIAMPLGFLLGMILALSLRDVIGWRGVFFITGSLGVLLSAVIFLGVREPQRGRSEPELADLEQISTYRFSWKIARDLFRKKSLLLLFTQGFFGVFPWNVITFWFFTYLERERGYSGFDPRRQPRPRRLAPPVPSRRCCDRQRRFGFEGGCRKAAAFFLLHAGVASSGLRRIDSPRPLVKHHTFCACRALASHARH